MNKELVKQIALEVINDYMAKQKKEPVAPATTPSLKDKARELLKKCDQNYQKNISNKLIDNN